MHAKKAIFHVFPLKVFSNFLYKKTSFMKMCRIESAIKAEKVFVRRGSIGVKIPFHFEIVYENIFRNSSRNRLDVVRQTKNGVEQERYSRQSIITSANCK